MQSQAASLANAKQTPFGQHSCPTDAPHELKRTVRTLYSQEGRPRRGRAPQVLQLQELAMSQAVRAHRQPCRAHADLASSQAVLSPSLRCFARRYCECFASGKYCEGCNCTNCFNNHENEITRQQAVESILERNPNAFRPKIQVRKRSQQDKPGARALAVPCQLRMCQSFGHQNGRIGEVIRAVRVWHIVLGCRRQRMVQRSGTRSQAQRCQGSTARGVTVKRARVLRSTANASRQACSARTRASVWTARILM